MSDNFSTERFQKEFRYYSLKWSLPLFSLFVFALILGTQSAVSSRIIAISDTLSVNFVSISVNTIGLFAIGVNVAGLFAIGVNVAGLFAIGVNVIGFFAIGANALGFFAVGYRACGIYVLSYEKKSVGISVFSPARQDAGAVGLFTRVFPKLKQRFS